MTILSIFQPWRSAGVSPLRGRNWRPVTSLASQGSLSQVLKCHHVACNGPVVRSPVSCGTCFYISVVPRSHRRTEVLAILCPQQSETTCRPSTKWHANIPVSNSKNKWICWFLGPEKSQTWGFRLTESHRKDAINIGSPCEMWRPWRSSRTNPPTFIRRSPAGDVAGVASWPDDQRFGGLMLWCFQAWNLGRFPTSCSLLMKWSCHQVTNYAPLRSNKHTLQLEIPVSWHMYQICIKSSPDGSPNRGYQYIYIYIYIVFASGKCCVSNMFKPSSWPSEGFACRVMRWEPRILRRPARPWSRSEFCRCWIRTGNVALAARCGFLLKDVGEISQVQGFETIPFPSFQYKPTMGMMARYGKIWQVIVHPCVAIHIVPLCSWPPHAQVQNLSQWGPRSAAGVRPRGWQTAFWRAILQGQGMSTSPIHRTWHVVHLYIYKMYTYNHIYTMIRSEDLSWTLCFICATTEVQTRQSKIHHLSPCIDVSLFHKQNIHGYVCGISHCHVSLPEGTSFLAKHGPIFQGSCGCWTFRL